MRAITPFVAAMPAILAPASDAPASPCEDWSQYPHLVSRVPSTSSVTDVAVRGTRAYFPDQSGLVNVVDLSDPRHPASLPAGGWIGTGGAAVTVEGDRLFTASSTGLHIFDVSGPGAPVLLGTWLGSYPYPAPQIDVEGTLAFLVGSEGVDIIDVTDPAAPSAAGTIPGFVRDVSASGPLLVTCGGPFVRKYDVNTPSSPELLEVHDAAPDPSESINFVSVEAVGAIVVTVRHRGEYWPDGSLIGQSNALAVFSLGDLSSPLAIETLASLGNTASRGLHVSGDRAWVASLFSGIHAVDISVPSAPMEVWHNWGGPTEGVATATVAGRVLLCGADRSDGLQVLDVTDTDLPHELDEGTVDPWFHHDATAAGDFAYTIESRLYGAGMGYGYLLAAHDVSDPENVQLLGSRSDGPYGDFLRDVEHAADALWLRGVGRLYRSDLSDPSTPGEPVEVGSGGDIEARDPYLVVARGFLGLAVLDAAAPGGPSTIAELGEHPVSGVSVDRDLVCTLGNGVFRTVDFGEPAAPFFAGELPMSGSWVHVRGSLAAVGESGGRVRFVDVTDRSAPLEVGSVLLPDGSRDAAFVGPHLWIAADLLGLVIVDASDPADPVVLGGLATDPAAGVTAHRDFVLLTEQGGFHRLPLDCSISGAVGLPAPGPRSAFRGAAPNPFSGATTIRWSLARAGPVRLDVLDVTGRRVRTLVVGQRRAGPGASRWDGRDAAGRPVPSGVYYLRMEADGSVTSSRVTRVR